MDQALNWIDIGELTDIPRQGCAPRSTPIMAKSLCSAPPMIKVYALDNRCPHRKGPLSEGIVHGDRVTCPLHNWVIEFGTGEVQGADEGCVPTFPVEIRETRLFLSRSALETFAEGVKE